MYKIGKISYINALPLFCGEAPPDFELTGAVPADLNAAVTRVDFDATMISRWAYTSDVAREYKILPNVCIAGDGEILSVRLFSKFPVEALANKKIYITSESGTSSKSFALICKKNYGFDPFENRVFSMQSADAVFLIGDAALAFDKSAYAFDYDLGSMWAEFAKMPLIYAVAVVRAEIYDNLAPRLSEYLRANIVAFRAEQRKFYPLAKQIFFRSCDREISDDTLDNYFSRLIYSLDADTFKNALRFVDENADIK